MVHLIRECRWMLKISFVIHLCIYRDKFNFYLSTQYYFIHVNLILLLLFYFEKVCNGGSLANTYKINAWWISAWKCAFMHFMSKDLLVSDINRSTYSVLLFHSLYFHLSVSVYQSRSSFVPNINILFWNMNMSPSFFFIVMVHSI